MNPPTPSNRARRKVHFLNADGMLACNPRDAEAAHRAEFEQMAAEDIEAVTCKKCWQAYHRIMDQKQASGADRDA
ncbi:MAG: hypothetical protein ACK2UW_13360 [Anaerolineales bacterium]|jgi:hypothetical protein